MLISVHRVTRIHSFICSCTEAVWLKQLNQDLTGISEPVVIYEYNQSAIAIAKNPQFHGRVNYINIKYHFI